MDWEALLLHSRCYSYFNFAEWLIHGHSSNCFVKLNIFWFLKGLFSRRDLISPVILLIRFWIFLLDLSCVNLRDLYSDLQDKPFVENFTNITIKWPSFFSPVYLSLFLCSSVYKLNCLEVLIDVILNNLQVKFPGNCIQFGCFYFKFQVHKTFIKTYYVMSFLPNLSIDVNLSL